MTRAPISRTRTPRGALRLAATVALGALALSVTQPAEAFLFFGRDRAAEPAPAPADLPLPPADVGSGPLQILPGAPVAPTPPPGAVAPTPPAAAVAPRPLDLANAPLPPRRPGDLPTASASAPAPAAAPTTVAAAQTPTPAPVSAPAAAQAAPVQTASAPPPAPAAPAEPIPVAAPAPVQLAAAEPVRVAAATPATDAEIVAAANAYFNGIDALAGRFVQVGSDGRRFSGVLYVQRPGRLRFEYDEPATIDVVADGRSVVVQDRRLGTQDLYPISQTPLKFLLGNRISLGGDIPVIGVERAGGEVDVLVQDRSTFAGTSDIRLTFDEGLQQLKEWRIVDAQGFETRVTLSGLQRRSSLDPSLFVINQERLRGGATDTY